VQTLNTQKIMLGVEKSVRGQRALLRLVQRVVLSNQTEETEVLLAPPASGAPDRLLLVLAFTGVPRRQMHPERGACNGRWDEVFRSLLACKQRFRDTTVTVIVLVEAVEGPGQEGAVAAVVIGAERLAQLHATGEVRAVELFDQWASGATVAADCSTALRGALAILFPAKLARVAVSLFASPDDSVVGQLGTRTLGSPTASSERFDLCVKLFGGPCHWAQQVESKRLPLLTAVLEEHFGVAATVVHLGTTRLRASQAVLCQDGVGALSGSGNGKIPRVAFTLRLGDQASLQRVAEMAHHFLVETMWFEQRRDTPRHHVTLVWRDADSVQREAAIAAREMEASRGDPELKARRRAEQHIRETGATMECFVPVWLRLLQRPAEPPNRSIRLVCIAECDTLEKLEAFAARVVQWELLQLVS
jgi:hypothetical protein